MQSSLGHVGAHPLKHSRRFFEKIGAAGLYLMRPCCDLNVNEGEGGGGGGSIMQRGARQGDVARERQAPLFRRCPGLHQVVHEPCRQRSRLHATAQSPGKP